MKNEAASNAVAGVITFILAIVFLVWLSGTDGCAALEADLNESFTEENSSGFNKDAIESAEDHVKQFRIAERYYEHSDAEFEARMAASYYLDAGDAVNYSRWKDMERSVKAYRKKR